MVSSSNTEERTVVMADTGSQTMRKVPWTGSSVSVQTDATATSATPITPSKGVL